MTTTPMQSSAYQSIPPTSELLEAVKPIRSLNNFDRLEHWIFIAVGVLTFVMFCASALLWLQLIGKGWTRPLALTLMTVIVVLISLWMISQLLEAALAWKAGFKPFADSVDARITREREWVDRLAQCDPTALREKAKHLDLEAKLITRRAAIGAAAVAITVTTLTFLDAGSKIPGWPKFTDAPVLICAAALGLSIGAIVLSILAGRLERVAGLMELAADRSKAN